MPEVLRRPWRWARWLRVAVLLLGIGATWGISRAEGSMPWYFLLSMVPLMMPGSMTSLGRTLILARNVLFDLHSGVVLQRVPLAACSVSQRPGRLQLTWCENRRRHSCVVRAPADFVRKLEDAVGEAHQTGGPLTSEEVAAHTLVLPAWTRDIGWRYLTIIAGWASGWAMTLWLQQPLWLLLGLLADVSLPILNRYLIVEQARGVYYLPPKGPPVSAIPVSVSKLRRVLEVRLADGTRLRVGEDSLLSKVLSERLEQVRELGC